MTGARAMVILVPRVAGIVHARVRIPQNRQLILSLYSNSADGEFVFDSYDCYRCFFFKSQHYNIYRFFNTKFNHIFVFNIISNLVRVISKKMRVYQLI